MTTKNYTIVKKLQLQLVVFLCLWMNIGVIWAEGSKDLYHANAKGGRAYLRANTVETFAFPYSDLGVHYVYAEEGERIALASDAQAYLDKMIFLYAPDGTSINLQFSSGHGKIANRIAELAGPRLPNQGVGQSRYIPIYYEVPAGGSGVYRVEFLGSARTTSGASSELGYSKATAWPYPFLTNYLIAWDISVAKKSNNEWNWVNGRVFTTVISMNNPSYDRNGFMPNSGFYGVFKILTKDGYVYDVDNNGNQGISFTFMVNSQGFHLEGDKTKPSYSSIPVLTAEDTQTRYHDPRTADTENVITQKIFYNLPDVNMPEEASAAMDGGKTWLKTSEKQLNITDIRVESAEGNAGNQGGNGAYIKFTNASSGGEYTITVKPKPGSNFTPRIIKGFCINGENKIYWDGKDGEGNIISTGHVILSVDLELHGAEVHFPYIDMELNENGVIIELLSFDTRAVRSDKIYWDDTSIGIGGGNFGSKSNPRNASHIIIPGGTSSRENGHIWGVGTTATADTFGDNHGIDTWTFIKGEKISEDFEIEVKVADLEVVSVEANKTLIPINEIVSYTVKIRNNGPHDAEKAVFSFQIPQGFDPVSIDFSAPNCGRERVPLAFDEATKKYTSQLDLKNQCEVTYTITIKAINPIVGSVAVEAAILRPADIVDPDASNQDENVLPTDPHYECENNGLNIPCNNIKENTAVIYTEVSFQLIKDGTFNDLNNDGFAQAGETITYILQVVNTGKTPIEEVEVIDAMLGGIITVVPVKSDHLDTILDAGKTWTYTVTYTLTKQDIANKGVYNQAIVKGKDIFTGAELEEVSSPTNPLRPNDPGYDINRPKHTYVALPTKALFITNPMVRQRMK